MMEFIYFLPLIFSSIECRAGTTAAYLNNDQKAALSHLCFFITFDVGDWNIPAPAEEVRMVRLQPDGDGYLHKWYGAPHIYPSFDSVEFAQIVASRPGRVWIIGNEMGSIQQDALTPDQYAQAYHDASIAILEADPSARLAVGGIQTVTSSRLAWLRSFLERYQARYGAPPIIDIWTFHAYIIDEQSFGTAIGIENQPPTTATLAAADDPIRFEQQIIDFVSFVEEVGGNEIWLTEYGILWPAGTLDENGIPFTSDRALAFMAKSLEILGEHPIDRYAWWNGYVRPGHPGDVGNLLNADGALTPLGEMYR